MPVDRWDPTPIYQQVAADLRRSIEAGDLEPGDALPSEQSLMAKYDVARDTVRQALGLLRDEAVIITIARRGSFVPPRRR